MISFQKEIDDMTYSESDFPMIVHPYKVSFRNSLEKGAKVYHEDIELKYFYEGSATLRVGDEIITAQAGDIIVINPYEFHATIDLGEQNGRYHYFFISLDFFSEMKGSTLNLRSFLLEQQHYFRHCIRGNEYLHKKLLQIVEEAEKKEMYYKEFIRGCLLEFFVTLMRSELDKRHTSNMENEVLRYYAVIEPALQKIRDSYWEKISIDELSELCNVSKCHFCRIFKQVTKMTVVQYLTEYRFKIADLMMEYTDCSIAEIALQCGFADESYFCRYYRKVKGISPYKNKLRILTK